MLTTILIYIILIALILFCIVTVILAYNLYKWINLTKELNNDVLTKLREAEDINRRITELQSLYKERIRIYDAKNRK